jgi:hypothetical protein
MGSGQLHGKELETSVTEADSFQCTTSDTCWHSRSLASALLPDVLFSTCSTYEQPGLKVLLARNEQSVTSRPVFCVWAGPELQHSAATVPMQGLVSVDKLLYRC